MTNRGHVFVAHGDLLRLACDSVLVPTDVRFHVRSYWGRWASPGDGMGFHGRRVSEPQEIEGQIVRYVDVGSVESFAEIQWLAEGVHQALSAAAGDLTPGETTPQYGRARPLIGMPVFGVGGGGFDRQRGAAIDAVLHEAGEVTASGMDVAMICLERSDYAAVQSRRSGSSSAWGLTGSQLAEADQLGEFVEKGYAALFLGAGVSTPAGLAGWDQLLFGEIATGVAGLPNDFEMMVRGDPTRAASLLEEKLGPDRFAEELRRHLQTDRHAVGHALLASLRIPEAVTTNVDALYELAANVPFGGGLNVIPWDHQPGRPPWLLKLHGDLVKGDTVFTKEQYESFERDGGPLKAVLQALLLTRHLIFVGYSMRDSDFIHMAQEVARILRDRHATYTTVGTVLALTPLPTPTEDWEHDLNTVLVGDDDPALSAEDARQLEIFLDRVAWRAAHTEASWLLDDRYAALVEQADRPLVGVLKDLRVPSGKRWEPLRRVLSDYGRPEL